MLILLQHVAVGAQDDQHVQQQIAEIASVQRLQPLLIEAIELLALAIGIGLALARVDIGGQQAAVLPAVYAGGELLGGEALVVDPFRDDELLEQAQLIVGVDDGVVRLQPDQLGMAAQHFRGDGVEGAQPRHALHRRADEMADALSHLPRGAVGEGDAEDLAGPGPPRGDNLRQPRGERRRLARARARQHQHGPFRGEHSLALGRVQRGKPVGLGAGEAGARSAGRGGFDLRHFGTTRERTGRVQGQGGRFSAGDSSPAPHYCQC